MKLPRFITHDGAKRFISTTVCNNTIERSLDPKKLEHYRNLNALDNADIKPNGWDEAKPFEAIPGPKPLPIIGNTWRFILPKIGTFYGINFLDLFKILHEQYGDVMILKGMLSRKPMVLLFDVNDFETLYRNEGVWPIREGTEVGKYYRKSRPNIFKSAGLLMTHGEEWFKLRSMVNPILMQPRNVLQYVDRMNLVADELNDNIKYLSEQNSNGEMPENFNTELYKWSLESIGVVTMDKHLGCLKRNVETDSEPQKLIQNVLQLFPLMYKLDVMPSLWKVISTPDLRKFFKVSDFMTDTNLKYINQCMKKLESQKTDQEDKTNVLQKLIKGDRDLAVVMALDMMTAGIDTTGRILGAALYFLAKNPEAQQQLRKEALTLLKTKDAPVTTEILSKASYLKAVIKETLRVAPIGGGNLRTTVKKIVLGGYQIPIGTDVVTNHLILCKTDQHFARANKFLPERWLSSTVGELSYKNVNPFVYAPFGYGPRGCVGKRLANLELEVALLKVIRNFEFKWPHEDMVFEVKLFYGMARPLKLHVKPLND